MNLSENECLPNIWGEGAIFAFSGLDGPTDTASGFVATHAAEPYGLLIHTPRRRFLDVKLPSGAWQVIVSTGDAYVTKRDEGELIVTFSAWHSIIGEVPLGVIVDLRFEDCGAVTKQDDLLVTEDRENGDIIVLIQSHLKFALSYGRTLEQAIQRAKEAIDLNVAEHCESRLSLCRTINPINTYWASRLLKKCFSVMKVNTCSAEHEIKQRWSTPDRVPHKDMWLWDTVFQSFAMNHYNSQVSWECLKSMLSAQKIDGMIAHHNNVYANSSDITQPPILAWGIWENYCVTCDRGSLKYAFDRLEKYLQWDLDNRDVNNNGLLEWFIEGNPLCRSGESGLDNSPRFDTAVELDATDFSTFIAEDMRYLSLIASELDLYEKAALWKQRSKAISANVHEYLWDTKADFYCDRHIDGRFSDVKAVTGFFPLLLADCPSEHVDRLVAALKDADLFGSKFPVPSVALNDSNWSTDMWRGATWINTNFIIIKGLRLHGRDAEAALLAAKTIEIVNKYYIQSGVVYEFYDAKDEVAPWNCDRKGANKATYDIRCKIDNIRDYHWTAAIMVQLLLDTYK